jgi:hypothetical protein
MRWRPDQIVFDIVGDETDDPVVTAQFETPAGPILAMAEVEDDGRTLRLIGMHLQGAAANAVGAANLRLLASVVMDRMDYDAIEIEGAVRTTGARPGHRPRPIRFTRRSGPAAGT